MRRVSLVLFALISPAMMSTARSAALGRHHGQHRLSVSNHGYDARVTRPYSDRADDRLRGNAYVVDPSLGFEEAPYDPGYRGPGAIIFNATKRAQHEPGLTNELAPDAKETATGGPVGGIPGLK